MCHLILSQTRNPDVQLWGTLVLALIIVSVGTIMLGLLRWMRASSRSLLQSGKRKPSAVTPDPWTESARRLRPEEPPADDLREP